VRLDSPRLEDAEVHCSGEDFEMIRRFDAPLHRKGTPEQGRAALASPACFQGHLPVNRLRRQPERVICRLAKALGVVAPPGEELATVIYCALPVGGLR
jgi:hypothetical protein